MIERIQSHIKILRSSVTWWLAHIRPYRLTVVLGIVISLGTGVVASIDPMVMRHLVDISLPQRQWGKAWMFVLLLALCFLGRACISGWGSLLTFRVTQDISQDLRLMLLTHISRLSLDWHEAVPLGEKMSRFDQDVELVAQFSSDIVTSIVRLITSFAVNLLIMLYLNWRMTLLIVFLVPPFVWLRARFKERMEGGARRSQTQAGHASAILAESLTSVPQVQLLTAESSQISRVRNTWEELLVARRAQRGTEIVFSLSVTGLLAAAIVLVLGGGVWEYRLGILSLGGLIAFYAYVTRFFDPISSTMEMYARVQRIAASVRRIREVLELSPSVEDTGTLVVRHPRSEFAIKCNQVSFTYPGNNRGLENISIGVESGERIALIGRSGSGKSTLSRLLVRLADPSAGEISLGGVGLSHYTLSTLRKLVTYVPQAPMLYAGTVRDNLKFGNLDATHSEIDRAIEAAGLNTLLSKLPRGLDAWLGPSGVGISGGEQQRLALARALLRKSEVLILDESTSALDLATEASVLTSIASLPERRSLILITHRIHSITWVDKLVLLDAGRMIAQGSASTLYATCPLYRELFDAVPEGGSIK